MVFNRISLQVLPLRSLRLPSQQHSSNLWLKRHRPEHVQITLSRTTISSSSSLFSTTIDQSVADSDAYKLQRKWHRESVSSPSEFWDKARKLVDWDVLGRDVITKTTTAPHYIYYPTSKLNTCYNCLDRHASSHTSSQSSASSVFGNQVQQPLALVYDSPLTSTKKQYTYNSLLHQVKIFAGVLNEMGVKKGDMVLIYMPMIPEAVIAMLAVARLGAIHSVVFGGFAPHELAKRIVDCKPKVILTASHGIERSDKIISYLPLVSSAVQESKFSPQCIINYDRSKDYSLFSLASTTPSEFVPSSSNATARKIPVHSWKTLTDQIEFQNKLFETPVPVKSTDPLYVLYTSGTTGQPKGVVRDNGGYSVALTWSMKNIFGINKGDRWFAASDIGWVVGHSYIVYAPLLAGATTILYEGKPVGTPDAGAYWRLIEEYGIKSMFTAPTALRAIKKEDSKGELTKHYDIRSLKNVWVAGERCDPDTTNHFRNILGKDILDHWWQTETGWPITGYIQPQTATSLPSSGSKSTPQLTIPCKVGSAGIPIPGYKVEVLSTTSTYDNPIPAHPNELGYVVIKLPLPPGCFNTLLGNHEGFVKSYLSDFKGYYNTSDSGYMDEDGYLYIMSRTDDVLNIAGHRLSTGAIEEVIAEHPNVAETAVVGLRDPLKGELPLPFVVLKTPDKTDLSKSGINVPQLRSQIVENVRNEVGAFANCLPPIIVEKLPKTRSGKLLRKTIKSIVNGEKWSVPATIEDLHALKCVEEGVTKWKLEHGMK